MPLHEDQGSERVTSRRLVFTNPFTLGDDAEVYSAGTYEVETTQETLEANGHRALRRTSTILVIPTRTGTVHRAVSGTELDQAFAHDAEQDMLNSDNENPDRGQADEHLDKVRV
jgi:hypothetical protein